MTMKFFVFVLAALAAATSTSSFYMVAAAASWKRALRAHTEQPDQPTATPFQSEIHVMWRMKTVRSRWDWITGSAVWIERSLIIFMMILLDIGHASPINPGAFCVETSDCIVPPGLEHGVCRDDICESGKSGSSCGQTSNCVPIAELNPPRAVCRNNKCQRRVQYATIYCYSSLWFCCIQCAITCNTKPLSQQCILFFRCI